MIGKQKQADDGIVTIACKVPKNVADFLNIIAESRGAVVNDLLKMCIMFLIETAKVSTDCSPDMKVLLNMLKVDANWAKMFNYCNSGKLDIAQVILVLQQSEKVRKVWLPREGFGLAMFDKPYFAGETRQTLSKDLILERVVELVMGFQDYWKLREIGEYLESGSMRETLSRMIDDQKFANFDEMDKNEMPGMGEVHDNGRRYDYGHRTKPKQHRTPDSFARDQRIKFDDDDREVADYEVEGWEGNYRQTEPEPPTESEVHDD